MSFFSKKYDQETFLGSLKIFSIILFGFLALIRIMKFGTGVDFNLYVGSVDAILHQMNPYDPEWSQKFYNTEHPPINPPTMLLFILPFYYIPESVRFQIYIIVNLIFLFLIIYTLLNKRFSKYQLILGYLLIINTIPIRYSMTNGQISIIAIALLFFSYQTKSNIISGIFLGISLALKFSIALPFFIIFNLIQKSKATLIALSLFLIAIIFPLFFGINLIDLYTKYLQNINFARSADGFASYASNHPWLVYLGFFKNNMINYLLIASTSVIVLWAIYSRKEMTHSLFFLLGCGNLLVAYHRAYDMPLIVPFLVMWSLECQKIPLILLSPLFLPYNWILAFANWVGYFLGPDSWIYLFYDLTTGHTHRFPIEAVYLICVFIYGTFRFLRENRLLLERIDQDVLL